MSFILVFCLKINIVRDHWKVCVREREREKESETHRESVCKWGGYFFFFGKGGGGVAFPNITARNHKFVSENKTLPVHLNMHTFSLYSDYSKYTIIITKGKHTHTRAPIFSFASLSTH